MTGFHAAGRRIDLGHAAHIPADDVREIYTRLGEISTDRAALEREDAVLDERVRDAINAKPEGVGSMLWAGESVDESIDDDLGHIEDLRGQSARLRKKLSAQRDAERIGTIALNDAIDGAADEIAKASLAKAKTLKAKLAMIDKMLGDVYDTHDVTMGLVHLLEARATEGGNPLTIRHIVQTPRVELGLAIEHVRQALGKLVAELDAAEATLKPSKRKKGAGDE